MLYDFVTLDVFTDRMFGGNPLAVLPDARGLKTEQMQAIAREFNYSETTFVLPPEDENNTRKVRIFTPLVGDSLRRPPQRRDGGRAGPARRAR